MNFLPLEGIGVACYGLGMEDFDWVTAREKCSPGSVFELLRLQVKEDVETRNKSIKEERDAFRFNQNEKLFSVVLPSEPLRYGVTFSLKGEKIIVERKNKPFLEATLTLNDEGECRLKVNGQEREFWQVRRMALEDLFFVP